MLGHVRSLVALPVVLVLVACAGGRPAPSAGGAASPTTGTSPSAAGSTPTSGSLTVYSGRSESLVGPLLEQFTAATGIEVNARYGDTAEFAAQILEEGDRSPADVFFAQDAGALGAVADAGLLTPLAQDVLDRVDAEYRDTDGEWVGASGRARVAAYGTETLSEEDLPASILDFTDPAWSGRIGWAPTNGSFQAFVTALRVLEGEEGARAWLEGIIANEPVAYEGNDQAVLGVAAGEVDVAFVNHYYAFALAEEQGTELPVANHYFEQGDPGSLVNVAGVGILASSASRAQAERLVDYLLSEDAQRYFAEETFEYPLIDSVEPVADVPDVTTLGVPDLDLNQLADLPGTVELLRDVGAID